MSTPLLTGSSSAPAGPTDQDSHQSSTSSSTVTNDASQNRPSSSSSSSSSSQQTSPSLSQAPTSSTSDPAIDSTSGTKRKQPHPSSPASLPEQVGDCRQCVSKLKTCINKATLNTYFCKADNDEEEDEQKELIKVLAKGLTSKQRKKSPGWFPLIKRRLNPVYTSTRTPMATPSAA